MRPLEFPAEVMAQIQKDRFEHPDPLVQRRMEVLLLKSLKQPHALIGEAAGMSRSTVQRLLRTYDKGGLEAVRTFHWKTPISALTPHRVALEQEFDQRPPHTVGEACERIERLTGVRRGPTQVREFLRDNLGLRWRKTAAIPVPPKLTLEEHAAKQAAFLKEQTPAATGRGPGGSTVLTAGETANGLLRGRRSLRARHIPGMPVEQDAAVCEGSFRASTL